MKKEEILERFDKIFFSAEKKQEEFLVSDVSNIIAVVHNKELKKTVPFKKYSFNKNFKYKKSKTINYFIFSDFFYNISYILKILKFFENEDFLYISESFLNEKTKFLNFKIDKEFSIIIGNVYTGLFKVENNGVWFIELEYDDDLNEIETGRTFVKWENKIATLKYEDRWERVLYKGSFIFTEIKETGDIFLL